MTEPSLHPLVGQISPLARRFRRLADLDAAAYAAVARTPTPSAVDSALRTLSHTANHSKISLSIAALLATRPGPPRQAAVAGVSAVALASASANLLAKRLARRHRPPRAEPGLFPRRYVVMPRSASFPSGHTASAVAFAVAVGRVLPGAAVPLGALAAVVGYSRVHTGVHYPGDVVGGAVLGAASAAVVLRVRRGVES
ncbi:phosphoesterase PA-phosphatase related [Catenulispora acidiphila DSM 44928]|uniref:Phosphoesterase PA-phosphatase related n=1 Tax=Catenulispora acidiphila (strain DSM 44928 / JCM 14897 / NBRC 102108 / NRRL B-24433 / ID139908) TaxID=479433 RepID=C7Q976_CATAD|nr:phosphatase PAP2 family protein [Catenulispora acidiphila]ACU72396.1 phosphoesterase PA-phosphatase related [Catenulispora acidiphila DSM 44928]